MRWYWLQVSTAVPWQYYVHQAASFQKTSTIEAPGLRPRLNSRTSLQRRAICYSTRKCEHTQRSDEGRSTATRLSVLAESARDRACQRAPNLALAISGPRVVSSCAVLPASMRTNSQGACLGGAKRGVSATLVCLNFAHLNSPSRRPPLQAHIPSPTLILMAILHASLLNSLKPMRALNTPCHHLTLRLPIQVYD